MSNFRRRLMQSIKQQKYTELEYLESTDEQYIEAETGTSQNSIEEVYEK